MLIHEKYFEIDSKRGVERTFLWFMEEVGELSSGIAAGDVKNIREEIVDVLMWLITIANISEVDLEKEIDEYLKSKRKNTEYK